MKILSIGASGMLGAPVTLELMRAGFELTLLGRNPEKLNTLFSGVEVVRGDIFDPSSLLGGMEGKDAVYINLSTDQSAGSNGPQPEREGINNIIEAALKSGIKRIGYISSLIKNYQGLNGFSWWAFDIKNQAVEKIKTSGIPYSIFYPSTFMETLDKQMMVGNRIMLAGKSEAPMWFISAREFGEQVAWAFKKAGDEKQEYPVQGPEPLTFDQAVDRFIAASKTKPKRSSIPLNMLKFMGNFSSRMNYSAKICEALNKYPEKFESEKTWHDLGKPTKTIEDYVSTLNL